MHSAGVYMSAALVSVFFVMVRACFTDIHTRARTHNTTTCVHTGAGVYIFLFFCDECIFFLVYECGAMSVFFCAGVCMPLPPHISNTHAHTNRYVHTGAAECAFLFLSFLL